MLTANTFQIWSTITGYEELACRLRLVNLSKDVFEPRTSAGSGFFSFLSGIFVQIFGQIISIIMKETKKYKFGIVNLF